MALGSIGTRIIKQFSIYTYFML